MFCKWCGNKLDNPGAACPVCGRMQGPFQNGNHFFDFSDNQIDASQPFKKDFSKGKIPVKSQPGHSQKSGEGNIAHQPGDARRKTKSVCNKAVVVSVASAVAALSLISAFGAFSALRKAEKFEEDLAKQEKYIQQSVNQMTDVLDHFKKNKNFDADISADMAIETTQYTDFFAEIEKKNSYDKESPDTVSDKVSEMKQQNQMNEEKVTEPENEKAAIHAIKPPRLQKRIVEGTLGDFEYVLVGVTPDIRRIEYCWEMITDEGSGWEQINNDTDTLRISADNSARYRLICSGEKDAFYTLSDLESGADRQLPFHVFRTLNKDEKSETIYEFEQASVESSGCSAFWEKSSDGLNWSSLGDKVRCIKTENDHSQYRLHVIYAWNEVFEIPQK